MPRFFSYELFGNTVLKYTLFVAALAVSCVIIRILGAVFLGHFTRRAERTKRRTDDLLVKSIRHYLLPVAYVTALYLTSKNLVIGPKLTDILNMAVLAVSMILGAMFASSVIGLFSTSKGKPGARMQTKSRQSK